MRAWPKYPVIYEINTWVWLSELSQRFGAQVTLATVPTAEWDALAERGFHAIWLMGVWERSARGRQISQSNQALLGEFARALPDFVPDDNVGSPYCIRDYVAAARLGGPQALRVARCELARRGLRLILDFVPNHVAPDHLWTREHPEYFVRGTSADLQREPTSFLELDGNVFACGRDPFFPAWPDVLQLNVFQPALHAATREILSTLAEQCDGLRCDMAMLVLNDVFARSWGARVGDKPEQEYWPALISAIKAAHPEFRFFAEAYWDLEWQLQEQGFDFCYDKRLYERLASADAEELRQHLGADAAYQDRLLRFIENHDEPRAATVFPPERARAAALALLTLSGAKLVHEGQLEGRRTRLPVFLARRPDEPTDEALVAFYHRLLRATSDAIFRVGRWQLCETSARDVLSWCWQHEGRCYLVLINFGAAALRVHARLPGPEFAQRRLTLRDTLSDQSHELPADELAFALAPWAAHLFALSAL